MHPGVSKLLTKSDIEHFRMIIKDPWWKRSIFVIALPVFFVVLALMQVHAAAQLANGAEFELADVIRSWLMPEVRACHPLEVAAIVRVERAFSMLLFAIVFLIASFALTAGRSREKRMATILRKEGLLGRENA